MQEFAKRSLERLSLPSEPDYRIELAFTEDQVRELEADIEDFLHRTRQADDITKTAAYFLSSARAKKARPLAVAIYRGVRLVGMVYGIRRCYLGIPTGIVEVGDYCGDGAVLFSEEVSGELATQALQAMGRTRFTWLIRLSWVEDTSDVLQYATEEGRAGRTIRRVTINKWTSLPLEDTYERFLNRLGSQTRRNMRYYRRRAEQEGWEFVPDIAPPDARSVIAFLSRFQNVGEKDERQLRLLQQRFEVVPGAFFSGLRGGDGTWIGIVGGWRRGASLFVILQLNHSGYAKASVSTVLRSYLIEAVIGSGVNHIQFLGDCQGILKKYCAVRVNHLLLRPHTSFFSSLGTRTVCWLFPGSSIRNIISEDRAETGEN
jgi:hypothetical protein